MGKLPPSPLSLVPLIGQRHDKKTQKYLRHDYFFMPIFLIRFISVKKRERNHGIIDPLLVE